MCTLVMKGRKAKSCEPKPKTATTPPAPPKPIVPEAPKTTTTKPTTPPVPPKPIVPDATKTTTTTKEPLKLVEIKTQPDDKKASSLPLGRGDFDEHTTPNCIRDRCKNATETS